MNFINNGQLNRNKSKVVVVVVADISAYVMFDVMRLTVTSRQPMCSCFCCKILWLRNLWANYKVIHTAAGCDDLPARLF